MRNDEFRAWLARADRRIAERPSSGWCGCQQAVVFSMSRSITRSGGVSGADGSFRQSTAAVASSGLVRRRFRMAPENMGIASCTGSSRLSASIGRGPGGALQPLRLNSGYGLRTALTHSDGFGDLEQGSGAGEAQVQLGTRRRGYTTARPVGDAKVGHRTAVGAGG